MKHKLGIVSMILGAALLLGASGLFVWNRMESNRAEQASAELIPQLSAAIAEHTTQTDPVPDAAVPLPPVEKEMVTVEIDGYPYIGYLTIPPLGLELPVMADWDYTRLKIAPCRFSGSTFGENLVVAAHNYRRHFGSIRELQPGDEVAFTDMEGNVTIYQVAVTDIVAPTAVEEVTAGDFPLTLVTCTYGGKTRLVVYCDAITN